MTELSKADRAQWVREAQEGIPITNRARDRRILVLCKAVVDLDAALTAQEQATKAAQDDATHWVMVADGMNHDTRCRNHFKGYLNASLCLRCQREEAEAESARLTAQVAELEREILDRAEKCKGHTRQADRDRNEARGQRDDALMKLEAAEAQVARLAEALCPVCWQPYHHDWDFDEGGRPSECRRCEVEWSHEIDSERCPKAPTPPWEALTFPAPGQPAERTPHE